MTQVWRVAAKGRKGKKGHQGSCSHTLTGNGRRKKKRQEQIPSTKRVFYSQAERGRKTAVGYGAHGEGRERKVRFFCTKKGAGEFDLRRGQTAREEEKKGRQFNSLHFFQHEAQKGGEKNGVRIKPRKKGGESFPRHGEG